MAHNKFCTVKSPTKKFNTVKSGERAGQRTCSFVSVIEIIDSAFSNITENDRVETYSYKNL